MSQLGLAFPARFSTRRQIHRTLSVMVAFALFTLGLATAPMALADPTSPLTVTNIASPTPVASGAEITYTITIVNTGGSKVTNLVLADQQILEIISAPESYRGPELTINATTATAGFSVTIEARRKWLR